MINNLIRLSIILIIISSCCNEDSIETARYELTNAELELIPYTNGQQINFKHSNGYTFDFKVIENKLEWKEYHDFCEWNCCGQDYFSYQVKTTKLQSQYPLIAIELLLGEDWYNNYDYNSMSLHFNFNYTHSTALQYDSLANFICDDIYNGICHDSIIINDKLYTCVVEKFFEYYNQPDSTSLVPESILYNNFGLLQIRMSNDETYSLNN